MSDSLIIIPTYKEKENIEKIILKIFSFDKIFDILVVDDNSPDGTAEIVSSLIKQFPDRLVIIIGITTLILGAFTIIQTITN